jgi:hypothetical protein
MHTYQHIPMAGYLSHKLEHDTTITIPEEHTHTHTLSLSLSDSHT